MEIGEIVTICDSAELQEMKLSDLVGLTAKVIEVIHGNGSNVRGYWVELVDEAYLNELEWYIPACSIAN